MVSDIASQTSVMLADSNPLVLTALAEMFEGDSRFTLIATSGTAEGFLGTAIRVPFQVGVIDWRLPALGGAKLIEVLRDQTDAPRLIVYGDDSGDLPRQAMAAGAAGFASRNAAVDALLDTCLAVAAGKMVFPFLDVRNLGNDPMHALSRKERAILEALSEGLSNRDLSQRLGISTNTVKFHLSNLYDKLGVKNRGQAIARYYAAQIRGGG